MIAHLHNKHVGSHVAIIGSSPSALLYSGDCDVSIGVNGASLLGYQFDYYVVGDPHAPDREWFTAKCARSRIIANIVATLDRQLYPDYLYPNLDRRAIFDNTQSHLVADIPQPVSPHHWFPYAPIEDHLILRLNPFLMYHGTITCSTLQLAWMMGAREIDLFGCAFSADHGYFYQAKLPGRVGERQVRTMQNCIDVLRSDGVIIRIHGKSVLN